MFIGEKGVARLENANELLGALQTAKQQLHTGATMSYIKIKTCWELGVEDS